MMNRKKLRDRIEKISDYSLIPWRNSVATILKDLIDVEDKEHDSLLNRIKGIEDALKTIETRLLEIERSLQPLSER